MPVLNSIAKWVVPFEIWSRLRLRKMARERELASASAPAPPVASSGAYTRQAAVDWLTARGLSREQVEGGSMPEASLRFACSQLKASGQPLAGLHVGNFVGVSLGWFAAHARSLHPESVVVSIDPDMTHRGIAHPAGHVQALLAAWGLEANALTITGYTLERTVMDDGQDFSGKGGGPRHAETFAGTHTLANLARLSPGRFDFVMIDGHHIGDYLKREVREVSLLLKPGGLLILDDVSEGWYEVLQVFEELSSDFEKLGGDGRVGLARKR